MELVEETKSKYHTQQGYISSTPITNSSAFPPFFVLRTIRIGYFHKILSK
ncbi:hypothetical protein MFUM_700020 [Methylacidiphilum fumariolicum SolV]|uniref:Uncharacterized protein n=2 Tax=Candidatus Methylacidiphilum fumarolicum TaxID=591154 RepID=I0JZ02_METFB|nr:conserved protein of unknown function [Candidatus Methylacidiphilum fumarolicum]CCG92471.1 hypothetical protein MFUM_700020 [Methylacidiphilum fumariolicum SolV]